MNAAISDKLWSVGFFMIIQGADVPLHVQLKNLIWMQIRSGELKAGDPLPGERQLSQQHGLSRTTVRQALNELVSDGVLYRKHGKGTFVASGKFEQNLTWLRGFAEELRDKGLSPRVKVLAAEMRPVPEEAAYKLHLQAGQQAAFIQRLVSVGEEPLFVDRTYLVAQIGRMVLGADLVSTPIYVIVEQLGYPIRAGEQTIGAVSLSEEDAALLGVNPGDPALSIKRLTFVEMDSPIEYTEVLYRADRYQYSTRLQRKPMAGTS
ncbi:MAG TPA: GntR family transcriptional regulator [Firmicutes bacterium]|nr:GntR family transcriptional regulator [Bacillota bacterium]